MQHVIESLVRARFLDGKHIKRFLNHADYFLVAVGIATSDAGVGFGNIEAARTVDNALFDAQNGFGQASCLVGWAAQGKKVRRCGLLNPKPGSFENSSISAATGGAISLMVIRTFLGFSCLP